MKLRGLLDFIGELGFRFERNGTGFQIYAKGAQILQVAWDSEQLHSQVETIQLFAGDPLVDSNSNSISLSLADSYDKIQRSIRELFLPKSEKGKKRRAFGADGLNLTEMSKLYSL